MTHTRTIRTDEQPSRRTRQAICRPASLFLRITLTHSIPQQPSVMLYLSDLGQIDRVQHSRPTRLNRRERYRGSRFSRGYVQWSKPCKRGLFLSNPDRRLCANMQTMSYSIINPPHNHHKRSTNMKTLSSFVVFIALVTLVPVSALAQGQMSVGAGLDIMMPVGSFNDHWSTGFGGTGEFDYSVTPKTNVTGKIGYLTWSAKNLPSGVSATYSAVPLMIGGKYYPEFAKDLPVRFYGHLELGLMIGSLSVSGQYSSIGSSKTDFTIAPSVGAEIPAGQNGNIDVSLRYFDISEKSSIGLRVGYKLAIL
jgi:hypothetical protein